MTSKIKFSQHDLEMIRMRVSLVDFIGKRVPLKRRGNDFWGCCPFHGEKTPSFHVREDKKYYHCFGCGAHGNIFDFAQFTRGGTFPETVEYLAELAGIKLEKTYSSPTERKEYAESLKAMDYATKLFIKRLEQTPHAQQYLDNRQLSKETIEKFKLGYARDSWNDLRDSLTQAGISQKVLINNGMVVKSDKGGYDRFRDRIMFPIENYKGETIAFGGRILDKGEPKYLNSPETKLFNKRYNLYALNINQEEIRKHEKVFVVEGYMDVIGLYDKGVKLAVAPLGTAITKEQILTLWKYNSAPIICLDGDQAGQTAALRIAKNILSELQPGRTLKFMTMPEDEDPDSFVAKFGADEFLKLANSTASIIKILWKEVIKNKNPKSPDDIATLRKDVNELVSQIEDDTVKQQYTKTFNDLIWDLTSFKKKRKANSGEVLDPKKGAEIAKRHKIQKAKRDEKFILALTLQYPEQTLVFEEQLSELDFSDHEHRALKKALIEFLDQESLDKESLDNYLKDINLFESKNRVIKSCEGIFSNINHQDIAKYWQKLHHQLQNESRLNKRSNNLELSVENSNSQDFDSNFMKSLTQKIKKGK